MHLQLKYCNLEGCFFRLQAFQSSLQGKTWRTLLPRGVAEVVFFLFFLARDKNVLAKCILQGLPHCPISLIVLGCVRGSDNAAWQLKAFLQTRPHHFTLPENQDSPSSVVCLQRNSECLLIPAPPPRSCL